MESGGDAMKKHTAGPWSQEYDGSLVMSGQVIAQPSDLCPDVASYAEGRANARLISAAPELLEALRDAVLVVQDATLAGPLGQAYRDLAERMRAAIRKAEGE